MRAHPSSPKERWLLFQLLCIDGEWTRALKQLQIWAQLEPEGEKQAQLHRGLVQSEMFRAEVFSGARSPGFIQEPEPWLHLLIQANQSLNQGQIDRADELRAQALNQAPSSKGESPEIGRFEWLCDSDSRLGPVFEMAVAGGYRWIPFNLMSTMQFAPTASLTDLVWRRVTVVLKDTTVLQGYTATRYAGSENAAPAHKLARETRWHDVGNTNVIGLGQKTLCTDAGDWGLLDMGSCRYGQGDEA